MKTVHINRERFQRRFDDLSQYGRTPDGGLFRPAFSTAHQDARAWFRKEIEEAGLRVQLDGAGNHAAILDLGKEQQFILGSHLDSVPNGGLFDGALGVVAALEVLHVVKENAIDLPFNLEAVDFTDQVGTFIPLMGSHAFSGTLSDELIDNPSGSPSDFRGVITRLNLTENGLMKAKRQAESLAGYLELHIEQDIRLENQQVQIGVVSGIVGIHRFEICFQGKSDHSGTTAPERRRDAGLGAAAFRVEAEKVAIASYPECVINVGRMVFTPGSYNYVPSTVMVSLEFRSGSSDKMKTLKSDLYTCASDVAEKYHLDVDIQAQEASQPVQTDPNFIAAIEASADRLGLTHTRLVSGAIHDAKALSAVCPVGVILVPSRGGVSHSAEEFTAWQDCVNGANLLLNTVLEIAEGSTN